MIEYLRKRGRSLIAYALYYSGVLWLLAAARFHRKAFVLTYHRVLPDSADTFSADGIVVRPETFARQMAFLRRHFRLLSIAELAEFLDTGRALPSRSCVITFDDGWFDNFEYALPILREQNIPAVIFVATEFIGGSSCFWQERLSRLLLTAIQHDGPPRRLAERHLIPQIGSMAAADQRLVIRDAINRLKSRPAAEVQALEDELRETLQGVAVDCRSTGDDRFMTWKQVVDLTKGTRVSVGSHGCAHVPLTALTQERASHELTHAREQITAETRQPVFAVAYPNGNFNDAVVAETRKAGYRLGFTTEKGRIDVKDHALTLPRINISEPATRTMPEFLCAILLVFQRLRRS